MRNKYYKKINEVLVPWKAGSHIWRKMLQMRDLIEHQIWWQVRSGNAHFWHDNWTGLGELYHVTGHDHWCYESITQIFEVVETDNWNEELLGDILLGEIADHLLDCIEPSNADDLNDKPWWQLKSKGQFSVMCA